MADFIINKDINVTNSLIKAFNLQNVKVQDSRNPNKYQAGISKLNVQPVSANPYKADTVQANYIQQDETRPAKMSGMGGIPTFVDIVLTGPSGNPNTTDTYTDNITGKQVEIPTIYFEAVICTVEFAMNIVKTPIQGRNGTVKEYIGQDDAKITFNGVICGTNGVYPKSDVAALYKWAQSPVSKGVVCGYLQNLGITNVVVESISIPQTIGGYSFQQFSLHCISDLPVELKIQ
jgi:hypothetical protein